MVTLWLAIRFSFPARVWFDRLQCSCQFPSGSFSGLSSLLKSHKPALFSNCSPDLRISASIEPSLCSVKAGEAQAGRRNETGVERQRSGAVSYTHLRAHETVLDLVCRLLLEK